MSETLESKHWPKVFYEPYWGFDDERPKELFALQYALASWDEVQEGDRVLIVVEGEYAARREVIHETSKTNLLLETYNARTYPYILRKDEDGYWEDVERMFIFDAIQAIRDELPNLHVELLRYFGFRHGDREALKESVLDAIPKHEELFPYLQCLYATL